jgi:soluble cytochrome b562
LYKILTVDNDFSNGKFTQVLHLVRYPNQDTAAGADTTSNDQRSETAGWNGTRGISLPAQVSTPIAKVTAAEDLLNKAKTEAATVTPSGIDPKLAAIKADGSTTAITDATAPAAIAQTTAKTIGEVAAANLEINRNISSLDALITTNQNSLLGARGALDILKIKSADAAAIAAAQGRVNELQNSIKLLQTARTELASKLQATP